MPGQGGRHLARLPPRPGTGMGAQTPRGTAEPKNVLLMASAIGPIDAGIVGALEDAYLAKTGVLVRHAGAGTGAALEMTKRGGFDLVMVHARALEDRFVAEGFGVDRRAVMYNAFVILGPAADPAGIRGEQRATVALEKIARGQALFVTRGDNSGTHVKEQESWEKAGRKPAGPWYVTDAGGADGNAPTTRYADQRQAYVLMDRATYLILRKEITLPSSLRRVGTESRCSSRILTSGDSSIPSETADAVPRQPHRATGEAEIGLVHAPDAERTYAADGQAGNRCETLS